MNIRRLAALAIAGALVLSACSSTQEAGVELSGTPTSVTITSGTGNVSVTAGDEGIMVTAEISASGEEPQWSAELVGDELVIDDACGDRTDCEVDLTIEIPGTADVTINSADGGVTVVDMNSTVIIAGAASNIVLNGITGPIDVDITEGDLLGARLVSTDASFHTGNGSLDVSLSEVFTSLSVTSDAGNVKAQVPGGSYEVDATTDTGDVEVDGDVVHVDGADSKIVMRTEDGNVTIYRK